MIRIRLSARNYQVNEHPFLSRQLIGWDPTMSEQEIYDAGRGWWRLSERAEAESYAVLVGGDVIRQVIEIDEWALSDSADRRAFNGTVLKPGHPLHDRLVGQPDPMPSGSRNPVAYFEDQADLTPCRCGCGELTRRDWVQGHDQIAIHRIIKSDFDGSVRKFVEWWEENGPKA
ncbi:hypothetical protein [Nocardiopsis sp. HUAS JQ3]|uniref:hypothetical protein n=1 Tax=Nocardiopsis sp. HUAS JQ3 TaxID=3061629 RepID=UPI0023A94373|nr:hypothetical protein [Nocardiopsis sp. HUAS JQ3]WDZ93111.1 hypothetical protein PV789_11505 [Nocardiopsis sp. HUAS JQ3]